MSLVAVVAAVVVPVAGPVFWDAAAAVALELDAGAGVAAAGLVAVVAAVVVCREESLCLLVLTVPPSPGLHTEAARCPTVVAAPVDVDAAAVGAGELGQREAGGVSCGGGKKKPGYSRLT